MIRFPVSGVRCNRIIGHGKLKLENGIQAIGDSRETTRPRADVHEALRPNVGALERMRIA